MNVIIGPYEIEECGSKHGNESKARTTATCLTAFPQPIVEISKYNSLQNQHGPWYEQHVVASAALEQGEENKHKGSLA